MDQSLKYFSQGQHCEFQPIQTSLSFLPFLNKSQIILKKNKSSHLSFKSDKSEKILAQIQQLEISQIYCFKQYFQPMPDPIVSKLIHSQNPEDIEKYVHKLLPNNPESLESIYIQLASFTQNFNDMIQANPSPKKINEALMKSTSNLKGINHSSQNKQKNYSSFKQLPKKSASEYYERNKQENIAKRQQSLIRSLRQRGLRGSSIEIPLGLQVIKKQQQKISQPLQSNDLAQLKRKEAASEMTKCLKRFNMNPNFYKNEIKDGDVDEEKYYDKDMKRFLDFRKSSLSKLVKQEEFDNETKLANSRRFSHVGSSVMKKSGVLGLETMRNTMRGTFFDKLPSQKKQKVKKFQQYANKKLSQAEQIIQICNDTLQQSPTDRPKSLLAQTKKYQHLRENTQQITKNMAIIKQKLQFDGLELQNRSEEIELMIKEYGKNGLIDKYTLNYMKMIVSKRRSDNILANRKDLIKNQVKFRHLINEQAD